MVGVNSNAGGFGEWAPLAAWVYRWSLAQGPVDELRAWNPDEAAAELGWTRERVLEGVQALRAMGAPISIAEEHAP